MSNHLRLDLVDQVVRNTRHDEYGCTCKPYAFHSRELTEQCRNQNHDAKEACVTPVETVGHLRDELGSRTARTHTGDKSAVLLQVLRDLDRVELNHRIEEHDMLNWLKATRKKMNAGELKEDRVELFQKLLEMGEKYKRVNQYQ